MVFLIPDVPKGVARPVSRKPASRSHIYEEDRTIVRRACGAFAYQAAPEAAEAALHLNRRSAKPRY